MSAARLESDILDKVLVAHQGIYIFKAEHGPHGFKRKLTRFPRQHDEDGDGEGVSDVLCVSYPSLEGSTPYRFTVEVIFRGVST